ncbi:hypothetical protein NEOLEDRAFT_1131895 [Neolentinus lepideus HHB14362 ss-1]|uniref:Uncharacterized protein n=1 Tax=Neolentinus lepideus HHB14362 ss-1 TaxID=1314782 RepID=A0A165TL68_9AGAM|nr:hypothetical protein NEOLEDRAFT_1131895 [Neolentinus lepideus HHB14362 ss-1]
MEELKQLAYEAIQSNLSEENIVEEAFSTFTATPGFDKIRNMECTMLRQASRRSAAVRIDLSFIMRRVAKGEFPHVEEMIGPLILGLLT